MSLLYTYIYIYFLKCIIKEKPKPIKVKGSALFKKLSSNFRFLGPNPNPPLTIVPHTENLLRFPAGLPTIYLVQKKEFLSKHSLVFSN